MKYTDLIFDLYGTLADIHTEDDAPLVWEKTALYMGFYGASYEPEELRNAYKEELEKANAVSTGQGYECYPDMPIEPVFEKLFARKGVKDSLPALSTGAAQTMRIASLEFVRLYPGVKEALTALRKKGLRLWLLSNAQHVFTAYEIEYLGLAPYFDGMYLSSDYQCRKPDKRFYDALITDRGLDASACLMIGNDLTSDIQGAKNAGMDSFYMLTSISPSKDTLEEARKKATYAVSCQSWHKILPMILRILEGKSPYETRSFASTGMFSRIKAAAKNGEKEEIYHRHCTPTAITNLILTLAADHEYPKLQGLSPEDIFRTCARLGMHTLLYHNIDRIPFLGGSPMVLTGLYLRLCLGYFGIRDVKIRPHLLAHQRSLVKAAEKAHPILLGMLFQKKYTSHTVLCYGTEKNDQGKPELILADGWKRFPQNLPASDLFLISFWEVIRR